MMLEATNQSDQPEESDEQQRPSKKRRLPPGELDVIYTSGFPPFWKIWKKGMMTIPPPEWRRRR